VLAIRVIRALFFLYGVTIFSFGASDVRRNVTRLTRSALDARNPLAR